VNTATSVRLPEPLRERVRAHALSERRSFSNTLRILIERGLDAVDVDADEVERLRSLALAALEEARSAA
jgi:hypothetical protein